MKAKKQIKRAKVLSDDEIHRVLAAAARQEQPERNRLIVFLSFFAGMRAKEIAAIRWGDVIHPNGTVKSEVYLDADQTKGDEPNKLILSDHVQREVSRYFKSLSDPPLASDPVIKSRKTGKAFSSVTIQNLFKLLFKASGLDNASSHSGRRTFLTNLSRQGVDARVIQEVARHKFLSTTQLYIDTSPDIVMNAVNKVKLKRKSK